MVKNYENLSTFGEVIVKKVVYFFLRHDIIMLISNSVIMLSCRCFFILSVTKLLHYWLLLCYWDILHWWL